VQEIAEAAGRRPGDVEAAVYLTIAVDEDAAKAEQRINDFLSGYYGQRPDVLKKRQACFSGAASGAADFINGYLEQGAQTVVLRFAGEHDKQLEIFARMREQLKG
jgi:alkanesulfonate monooxygenase SsuD/methylene tetrahydromethanopterin reductase-like flavin-dependent oxidoreductase (luciferase family)